MLFTLQNRGKLSEGPGEDIYVGQIVVENPRRENMLVNRCKAKQFDNLRSGGEGIHICA